jgi:translation initiation factor IF-2
MNLLVEDWWKIQSHDISAKVGTGVKELLEVTLSRVRFKVNQTRLKELLLKL